ncbi:MAG: inner membrane CreD family protein [Phycisphaerae bacterium]|nr:inner membrane CreD family protein [Phycisphaerae bacterium]
MAVLRFFAVVLIFICVTVAWAVLGGSMWARTQMLDDKLSGEMASLWGPTRLVQPAPYIVPKPVTKDDPAGATDPAASTIDVDISHQRRYKGLLWYSTFAASLKGTYTVPAIPRPPRKGGLFAAPPPDRIDRLMFHLPLRITSHDGLAVLVDGKERPVPHSQKTSGTISVKLNRATEHEVTILYTTYGQDFWEYLPRRSADHEYRPEGREWDRPLGSGAMGELTDFTLTIDMDFKEIDYPKGTRSPTRRATPAGAGMQAQWRYESLVTNQAMGIAMPKRPNAGPIVRRMSFFAPVSLFFFFTVLFTVVVLRKTPLHPMHYLFISAAFFAFHLLLAYLVDKIGIHSAFWICAAVSVFLVVSYMRLVAGVRFAATYVAGAQLVYLIGFSYAFFFPGNTGLTVAIGAILTLFVLMQATGRVKWHEVFGRKSVPKPPAAPPAPPVPVPLRPAGGGGQEPGACSQ